MRDSFEIRIELERYYSTNDIDFTSLPSTSESRSLPFEDANHRQEDFELTLLSRLAFC